MFEVVSPTSCVVHAHPNSALPFSFLLEVVPNFFPPSSFDFLSRMNFGSKVGKEKTTFGLHRATIIIFLVVLGVMSFIVLATRVSHAPTHQRGSVFDPLENPNVHVEQT